MCSAHMCLIGQEGWLLRGSASLPRPGTVRTVRHFRSILYAVVLAPAVWVLVAVGLTHDLTARGRDGFAVESFTGLLMLLLGGAAYGILVFAPISPLGPTVAGVAFLAAGAWAIASPSAYADVWPAGVAKDGFDLSRPGYGLAALLSVPMIMTVLSVRRWRGYEPPVLPLVGQIGRARGAAPAPGVPIAAMETAVLPTERTTLIRLLDGPDERTTSLHRPAAFTDGDSTTVMRLPVDGEATTILRSPRGVADESPTVVVVDEASRWEPPTVTLSDEGPTEDVRSFAGEERTDDVRSSVGEQRTDDMRSAADESPTEEVRGEPATVLITEEPPTDLATEEPTADVAAEEPTTAHIAEEPPADAAAEEEPAAAVDEEAATVFVAEESTTADRVDEPAADAVTEGSIAAGADGESASAAAADEEPTVVGAEELAVEEVRNEPLTEAIAVAAGPAAADAIGAADGPDESAGEETATVLGDKETVEPADDAGGPANESVAEAEETAESVDPMEAPSAEAAESIDHAEEPAIETTETVAQAEAAGGRADELIAAGGRADELSAAAVPGRAPADPEGPTTDLAAVMRAAPGGTGPHVVGVAGVLFEEEDEGVLVEETTYLIVADDGGRTQQLGVRSPGERTVEVGPVRGETTQGLGGPGEDTRVILTRNMDDTQVIRLNDDGERTQLLRRVADVRTDEDRPAGGRAPSIAGAESPNFADDPTGRIQMPQPQPDEPARTMTVMNLERPPEIPGPRKSDE
jgi:hypothetical protein